MRITIAGYGSIGQFVKQIFGRFHEVLVFDPPKGLGRPEDLNEADFVFVCVPTPSLSGGEYDTSVVEEIVEMANPKQAIVCHSTVAIGTTERLIQTYRKPLVYVPEWAGESSDHPYRQIENRLFFILGGYDPALSKVRTLFETVYGEDRRYFAVSPTVAEIVKYMENAFLALKVSFCNEFFDLCRAFGVDYELVRGLLVQDNRIHPGHTTVTPERGYGGKCLPKDVAAVCSTGRRMGVAMEIMEAVQRANARHRESEMDGG